MYIHSHQIPKNTQQEIKYLRDIYYLIFSVKKCVTTVTGGLILFPPLKNCIAGEQLVVGDMFAERGVCLNLSLTRTTPQVVSCLAKLFGLFVNI